LKVFISSVIAGFEQYRAAAREATESLGHTVIAAEDFGASPESPQQVCLAGVREAALVVLLLGKRYGTLQTSGLSPTHEEYRDARGKKPVFVFFQTGVTPESAEAAFIEEANGWEGGQYRQPFDTVSALRAAVTRALHQWELNQQAGPVDEKEVAARASALLPQSSAHSPGSPTLHVVVTGGPAQQVLRPSALDDPAFQQAMEQEALYGQRPVFERTQGVRPGIDGATLFIRQPNAEIIVNEQGSVRVSRPGRDAEASRPVASPRSSKRRCRIASPRRSTMPGG
jgi:hypothetical protein